MEDTRNNIEPNQRVPWARNKRRELSDDEREAIYQSLLELSTNGVLKRGHKSEVARRYAVHASTVNNIWERAQEAEPANVRSRKAARRRCAVYNPETFAAHIATLPPESRSSLRELSRSTGASLTTVRKMFQLGAIDPRYLSRRATTPATAPKANAPGPSGPAGTTSVHHDCNTATTGHDSLYPSNVTLVSPISDRYTREHDLSSNTTMATTGATPGRPAMQIEGGISSMWPRLDESIRLSPSEAQVAASLQCMAASSDN